MTRVNTAHGLAEALETDLVELSIESRAAKIGPEGLHVAGARIDRLELSDLSARGPVHLERSTIRWLTLSKAKLREGLLVDGCHIGTLELRSVQALAPVTILQTRADSMLLHEVTRLSMSEITAINDVLVSSAIGRLSVLNLRAGRLRIFDELLKDIDEIELRDVSVEGPLIIRGPRASGLQVVRTTAADVEIESCGRLEMEAVGTGLLSIHAVSAPTPLRIGGRCTELHVRTDADIRVSSTMSVSGDLSITGPCLVDLEAGSIGGTVRNGGCSQARVHLGDAVSVEQIESPRSAVRSGSDAHDAAASLFSDVGARELSLVRYSLRERPEEQDVAYFAQRQFEAKDRSWAARVFFGHVLGWGVRLGPPARALLVGIVVTGLAIHGHGVVREAESIASPTGMGRASVLALQLWTNVGVGLPTSVRGGGWAAASVLLTCLGIAFTTLLLGVVLRRLVR